MDVIEESAIPIEDEKGKIFVIHVGYYATKERVLLHLSIDFICLLQE